MKLFIIKIHLFLGKLLSNDFHGSFPAEIGNLEYLNIL